MTTREFLKRMTGKSGHIKTRSGRQHSWRVDPWVFPANGSEGNYLSSECGYMGFDEDEIDFNSSKPVCKECQALLQRLQKAAAKAIESLQE